jgi:hypothetical protein
MSKKGRNWGVATTLRGSSYCGEERQVIGGPASSHGSVWNSLSARFPEREYFRLESYPEARAFPSGKFL